jgi:hypothetical protein
MAQFCGIKKDGISKMAQITQKGNLTCLSLCSSCSLWLNALVKCF